MSKVSRLIFYFETAQDLLSDESWRRRGTKKTKTKSKTRSHSLASLFKRWGERELGGHGPHGPEMTAGIQSSCQLIMKCLTLILSDSHKTALQLFVCQVLSGTL